MASYFVNPWMLLALIAGAIPIIIELIFRRRRRQIDLPTLRYLLANPAQKKIQRQDRLLLILRCILPLLLAAAVARPLLAPAGAVRNRHVIILMDQTMSMGQQVGVSNAFAQAKSKASRLIAALSPGTKVSVISFGLRPAVLMDHSDDLYAARELIDAMKITYGGAALADAMPLVQESLAKSGADQRQEIYLFSDFQKTTILRKGPQNADPIAELHTAAKGASVTLVDVGGERPFNYYFSDFGPDEPLLVADRDFHFHATVEAKGASANPDPHARVMFLVNQIKQGMQEVPLKTGSATVGFDYRFPAAGEYQIEVSVEGDTFRMDNHRYYLAAVPDALKVLIIDEASGDGAMSPEAAYLSAAISPMDRQGLDRPSIFTCKVIAPGAINRENLSEYSSAIVLGLQRVPDDLVIKLEPYIRDGGSAVFFLSGQSNPFEYNQHLFKQGKGVMPVRLDKSDSGAELAVADLTFSSHLAIPTSQPTIPIARYMTLNGPVTQGVLASFSGGKPAVVESEYGNGRVLTFCTAAGPPDNLLPASFVYPLMLQEMLRLLADNPDRDVNLQIGQGFHQNVMISSQHLMLRKPDGGKVRLTPTQAGADVSPSISFDETDQMGLYTLDAQAGVVKRPRFVVNLGAQESDLDRLEESDARNILPEATWLRPAAPIESITSARFSLTELSGPLLWALAALMIVETFLAVRFGMRRH